MGLRIQLGHRIGDRCPTREPGHKSFTIIHINGIHQVNVDFCRCVDVPHYRQLLAIGWWPATPLEPRSCATIDVLRHFQVLNLQGKLTAFSFYRTLEYLTDNARLESLPVS